MRVVLIFTHLSNVNNLHLPQLNPQIEGYHLFWKFEVPLLRAHDYWLCHSWKFPCHYWLVIHHLPVISELPPPESEVMNFHFKRRTEFSMNCTSSLPIYTWQHISHPCRTSFQRPIWIVKIDPIFASIMTTMPLPGSAPSGIWLEDELVLFPLDGSKISF